MTKFAFHSRDNSLYILGGATLVRLLRMVQLIVFEALYSITNVLYRGTLSMTFVMRRYADLNVCFLWHAQSVEAFRVCQPRCWLFHEALSVHPIYFVGLLRGSNERQFIRMPRGRLEIAIIASLYTIRTL